MVALRPLMPILLLLLAGCSEPSGTVGADDAGTEGADDGTDNAGTGGDGDGSSAARAYEAEPIDWEGNLGTGACLPSGPGACTGVLLGFNDYMTLEGRKFRNSTVELELTWDAVAHPWAQELELSVWPYTSCGQNCYQGTGAGLAVTGGSPLTLSDDVTVSTAHGLFVSVEMPRLTPDPVYGFAHADTPFHVTGTVTPF